MNYYFFILIVCHCIPFATHGMDITQEEKQKPLSQTTIFNHLLDHSIEQNNFEILITHALTKRKPDFIVDAVQKILEMQQSAYKKTYDLTHKIEIVLDLLACLDKKNTKLQGEALLLALF